MNGRADHYEDAALVLTSAATFVERGWTTGAAARDDCRMGCEATSERAVAWCALGAIHVAAARLRVTEAITECAEEHLKLAATPGGIEFITGWNDRKGQRPEFVTRAMRNAARALNRRAAVLTGAAS